LHKIKQFTVEEFKNLMDKTNSFNEYHDAFLHGTLLSHKIIKKNPIPIVEFEYELNKEIIVFRREFTLFDGKEIGDQNLNFNFIPFGCNIIDESGNCIIKDARYAFFEKISLESMTLSNNMDFRYTVFSGYSNFSGVQFTGTSNFINSHFAGYVDFTESRFESHADFKTARFLDKVEFAGAWFLGNADFSKSQFSGEASFWNSQFLNTVCFHHSQFFGDADFKYVQFGENADFSGSRFEKNVFFWESHFFNNVHFSDSCFISGVEFYSSTFEGNVDFKNSQFLSKGNFSTLHFLSDVDFEGAKFSCDMDFHGSQFSGSMNFVALFVGDRMNSESESAVYFDDVKFLKNIIIQTNAKYVILVNSIAEGIVSINNLLDSKDEIEKIDMTDMNMIGKIDTCWKKEELQKKQCDLSQLIEHH
jgi:hypothetical protein